MKPKQMTGVIGATGPISRQETTTPFQNVFLVHDLRKRITWMSRDIFGLRSGSRDEEVMNRKGEAIAMMGQAPVMKSRKSEENRARDGGGKSKKEVLSQRARNYTTLDYIIRCMDHQHFYR